MSPSEWRSSCWPFSRGEEPEGAAAAAASVSIGSASDEALAAAASPSEGLSFLELLLSSVVFRSGGEEDGATSGESPAAEKLFVARKRKLSTPNIRRQTLTFVFGSLLSVPVPVLVPVPLFVPVPLPVSAPAAVAVGFALRTARTPPVAAARAPLPVRALAASPPLPLSVPVSLPVPLTVPVAAPGGEKEVE